MFPTVATASELAACVAQVRDPLGLRSVSQNETLTGCPVPPRPPCWLIQSAAAVKPCFRVGYSSPIDGSSSMMLTTWTGVPVATEEVPDGAEVVAVFLDELQPKSENASKALKTTTPRLLNGRRVDLIDDLLDGVRWKGIGGKRLMEYRPADLSQAGNTSSRTGIPV